MKKQRGIVGFLAMGMVIIGVCCMFASNGYAKSEVKLTYANFPPGVTFPCVQMERWKEEVEKRTDGKVEIQTFPGSTLLNPKNMFDGVVSGLADIGCLAMSYQPGRFPVSEAVDLPLFFPNAKVATMTLYDLIMYKYEPKEFEKVKIITLFTCPPSSLMTSKPVKKLDDLNGFDLRVSGTGTEVISKIGGSPVAMPMSDTPDAIQRGTVKGIVSSMEILKDFNFASYCPYATRENLHVVTFAVVMNKDKWNSLSDEVKKVIDDLRREQALWTAKYVDDHVEEALEWSKEKYNHEVFEFSPEEQTEIKELLKPMVDDYIKKVNEKGLSGEKIIEDIMNLKEKYEEEFK